MWRLWNKDFLEALGLLPRRALAHCHHFGVTLHRCKPRSIRVELTECAYLFLSQTLKAHTGVLTVQNNRFSPGEKAGILLNFHLFEPKCRQGLGLDDISYSCHPKDKYQSAQLQPAHAAETCLARTWPRLTLIELRSLGVCTAPQLHVG